MESVRIESPAAVLTGYGRCAYSPTIPMRLCLCVYLLKHVILFMRYRWAILGDSIKDYDSYTTYSQKRIDREDNVGDAVGTDEKVSFSRDLVDLAIIPDVCESEKTSASLAM